MNLTVVEATTIGEAWFKALKETLLNGFEYSIDGGSSGTEGKKRKELDIAVVKITNPGVRPLSPDVPVGVPAPTDDNYIEEYLDYLLTSISHQNEEYTYGEYLEEQFGEVEEMLKKGHNTNQACMTVGDKYSIYFKDPPCLRVVDCRIRYGKMHWFVYFRSWDLWGGFPTNLGGLQMAKELLADMVGVEDGELIAFSKGLHLYDSEWEVARMVTRI